MARTLTCDCGEVLTGAEITEEHSVTPVGFAATSNVEAARNAGVNLAFFSANEVFWKTRWEPSIDGTNTQHRTLVCYKETKLGQTIDPSPAYPLPASSTAKRPPRSRCPTAA